MKSKYSVSDGLSQLWLYLVFIGVAHWLAGGVLVANVALVCTRG